MPDGTAVNYGDREMYGRQSVCGEALSDLAARWAEILKPHFAFADVQYAGAGFLKRATDPGSVSNPAPPGTRYWDYLWSLSCWSPALLTEKLETKLKGLELTQAQRAKFDSFWGQGHPPYLARSLHGRPARPVPVHLRGAPWKSDPGGQAPGQAGGPEDYQPGVPEMMATPQCHVPWTMPLGHRFELSGQGL